MPALVQMMAWRRSGNRPLFEPKMVSLLVHCAPRGLNELTTVKDRAIAVGVFRQNYRKTSSISRTKSQNINISNLVLQLPLLNPFKPGDKSRMKM